MKHLVLKHVFLKLLLMLVISSQGRVFIKGDVLLLQRCDGLGASSIAPLGEVQNSYSFCLMDHFYGKNGKCLQVILLMPD